MILNDIYDKQTGTAPGRQFIEDIIDGMFDWVRVIDRNDNIIFINKAMSDALGSNALGKKCYTLLGKTAPCENCISRKAVFDDSPHEKEEIIDGRVFSVMSSPLKNEKGEIIAAVEVLRDVTQMIKLQKEIIKQNKKLQDDLKIAKKLQCSLLPKEFPDGKVDFSFVYKPCEALGGDFVDIFKVDESHIGVYIADVSGHGVPASLLTVFLRSTINRKTLSPAKALKELYNEFNSNQLEHDLLYITVFYAIIDLDTKSMVYSNAGHNVCPVVFNKNKLELLMSPGIPISNWLDDTTYVDKNMGLGSGDRIFFYTDGIIDLKNDEGEHYGDERLLDILLSSDSSPANTLNSIVEDAGLFAGINNAMQIPDDITMALLEIK